MNNKKIMIIMVNIGIIFFIAAQFVMFRSVSTIMKYGKDWEVVDVTINDNSFENDGFTTDSDTGNKTYSYKINRTLTFEYKGKEYNAEDIETIESSDGNYKYELRKDYKDKYTYKVNPENPLSHMKSYSSTGDTGIGGGDIDKIIMGIMIVVLVIVDVIYLIKNRKKKYDIFEN